MTKITRRATLGVAASTGWACALESRSEGAPQDASAAPAASSKTTNRPRIVSLRDFERLASQAMTPAAWEFISSGAGDEHTVRWNEEAFGGLRLRQRALVDVSRLDTTIRLLGREWPHPIFLAPSSNHTLVHPEGEIATARGAAAAGATLVVSTFADKPLEEIARATNRPCWHATYVMKDRGRSHDLLMRAEAAACEAICIPIDSPVVGARDREQRTYRFPRDPISLLNYPVDYWRYPTTWKDIDWVRARTKLPLVLKGILDPDDADRGIRAGAAAIYVSNHGGRNLDTLPATLETLPEVTAKVSGRVPILFDGGVRRGSDVLKALALGATAVAIGRPYLYGLAVGGAEGVRGVVNILRNELEMAMALTGRPTIASLDRSLIFSAAGFPKA
jgi:4-hydroxymandelate oxidase